MLNLFKLMCSIPSRMQIWETLGKHAHAMNVSENMLTRFADVSLKLVRVRIRRKALAKVESDKILIAFSFFSWCVHNGGLESLISSKSISRLTH